MRFENLIFEMDFSCTENTFKDQCYKVLTPENSFDNYFKLNLSKLNNLRNNFKLNEFSSCFGEKNFKLEFRTECSTTKNFRVFHSEVIYHIKNIYTCGFELIFITNKHKYYHKYGKTYRMLLNI
jgi:hypothetical protein